MWYMENVRVSAYLNPGQAKSYWASGFSSLKAHEYFTPRRPYRLFGEFERHSTVDCDIELKDAYFAGVLFPYYGHFLIESLSCLPNIPDDGIPIVYSTLNNTVKDWQVDFFRDMGIHDRVIVAKKNSSVFVKKLYKPEQSALISCNLTRQYICYVQSLFKPVAGYSTKPVYISRSHVKNAKTYGEEEFEDELFRLGFDIFYPESGQTIKQQVEYLDRAKLIVAIEGSALHSLLFCRSPKKILMLNRREEANINFKLQFSMQPHFDVEEILCMEKYASTFLDNSRLNIDNAILSVKKCLDTLRG